MVTGKRVIGTMRDQEMYFMADKWTRLVHKLLNNQVQAIGKQARYRYPQHSCTTLLYELSLTLAQGSLPPVERYPPHHQEQKREEENQRIGTEDHQPIKPGGLASMAINILEKHIVKLQ